MRKEETIVIATVLILVLSSSWVSVFPVAALAPSSSSANPVVSLSFPMSIYYEQPTSFQGWANVSSAAPQDNSISIVEYSFHGTSNVTLFANTNQRDVQFSFNVTINYCDEGSVVVYAEDNIGNWGSSIWAIPCPADLTFSPTAPLSETQLGNYEAVNATFSNFVWPQITAVVFLVVQNQLGQTVEISTSTTTFLADTNTTSYLVVFGIPTGNYTGIVFILATTGVPLSVAKSLQLSVHS